jgi:glycine/D-amino acid oxidase-like deaminating enzyme
MVPQPERVTSDAFRATADVVVIGGGIIGVATTLFLALKGVSTVLCEKGEIAGEQSGRNQGWCRVQNRDPRELPLMLWSLDTWAEMDRLVEDDTGFRRCGTLKLFANERQAEDAAQWLSSASAYRTGARFVGQEELSRLLPDAATKWGSALHAPLDGRAEPQKAAPAMARAARRHGATILTRCAVRGIESSAGRVSGVVTEQGTISCRSVVLAGGVWSSLFCRSLGLRLPQLKTMSSLIATAPLAGAPEISTMGPDFIFRKRDDGGYTIGYGAWNRAEIVPDSFRFFADFLPMLRTGGNNVRLRIGRRTLAEALLPGRWKLDAVSPFEKVRELDPTPSKSDIAHAERNIKREFPIFRSMKIANRWAGLIDVMPDTIPVISPVDSLPGFFISSGYSGHGFGIAPGAGRLTADLVTGEAPIVDPHPFRFSRFE